MRFLIIRPMAPDFPPDGKRLGPSGPIGYADTVGELIIHLLQLDPYLPIFFGPKQRTRNSATSSRLRDPGKDYVPFTHVERTFTVTEP